MGKRIFTRRRPFRRKRMRGAWVLDTFESILDGNVVAGNVRFPHILSLFEKDDYEASPQIIQKGATLLHAHVDVQWNFRPLASGFATMLTLSAVARWALVIADFEDQDLFASVLTIDTPAQNTLLQGGVRVLRVGQVGAQVVSPTSFAQTGLPASYGQPHTVIRWSGRARVAPDQAVYLVAWLHEPTGDIDSWFLVNMDTLSRLYVRAR